MRRLRVQEPFTAEGAKGGVLGGEMLWAPCLHVPQLLLQDLIVAEALQLQIELR